MKIACMQPYILPAIQYFQLISSCDTFVFLNDVNFINKGFIHKNFIINNKKKEQITIQIKKKSQNRLINQLEIFNNNSLILKKINFSYKNSKNFKIIFPIIEEIFNSNLRYLDEINIELITKICKLLGIKKKFKKTSAMNYDYTLAGEKKIIEIVKTLKGSTYINPIGGKKIYKKENFLNDKINLKFLKSNLEDKIEKNLQYNKTEISILHLVMNNDLNKIFKELNKFQLEDN